MKEWSPSPSPPPPPSNSKFHVLQLSSPSYRENYAVHIPRDQIHRVPPLEHSRIIEQHIRLSNDPARDASRRTAILIFGSVLAAVVLFFIILGILRATIYNATPPKFSIQGIRTQNLEAYLKHGRPVPIYRVTLRARNPKPSMDVSYRGGRAVSLTMKSYDLGAGKFPFKFMANGADVEFQVSMTGRPDEDVEESLTGAATKQMEFRTEVPVEMRSWAKSQKWDLYLYCEFKVKNSLAGKATKIVSQECQTEDQ